MLDGKVGVIEAALIKLLFDANQEKDKLLNRISNYFRPFQKQLINHYGQYAIKYVVFSLEKQPTDDELDKIRREISLQIFEQGKNMLCIMNWGVVGFFPERQFPMISDLNSAEFILIFKNTGSIVSGQNTDINQKILRLIDEKKKQHSKKYSHNMKVFYFFIDFPSSSLQQLDDNRIDGKLSDNEIVVISAAWSENGRVFENKKIYGVKKELFDFSTNIYQDIKRSAFFSFRYKRMQNMT